MNPADQETPNSNSAGAAPQVPQPVVASPQMPQSYPGAMGSSPASVTPQVPQPALPTYPTAMPNPGVMGTVPPMTPQTKRSKKWIWIVVIVVVVLAALVVAGLKFANSATAAPIKVSNEYVSDLQSGNYSAAQDLESSEFKQVTSESQLQTAWESTRFPSTSFSVIAKSIESLNGQKYSVVVYKFSDVSNPVYLKIELINKAGTWQIIRLDSTKSTDTTLQ